ncbi:TPA: hypothetical protein LU109_003542 [Enterobacter hormaechei subsp. xiangfangensis]|nr:hypothetical protein [Enterobacter hormaechei subsp. xiangfangensis]
MTVIAWDGDILAADGLTTQGQSIITTHQQKIFRSKDYPGKHWTIQDEKALTVAVAGHIGSHMPIIGNLEDGLYYDSSYPKEQAFTAIVITENGVVWVVNKDEGDDIASLMVFEGEVLAIGCGSDAATAAMIAGRNAIDAVAITMDVNVHCGGDIQAWTPVVIRRVEGDLFAHDNLDTVWLLDDPNMVYPS